MIEQEIEEQLYVENEDLEEYSAQKIHFKHFKIYFKYFWHLISTEVNEKFRQT